MTSAAWKWTFESRFFSCTITLSSSAAVFNLLKVRAARLTFAFRITSSFASSKPMPCDPPVIKTFFPWNESFPPNQPIDSVRTILPVAKLVLRTPQIWAQDCTTLQISVVQYSAKFRVGFPRSSIPRILRFLALVLAEGWEKAKSKVQGKSCPVVSLKETQGKRRRSINLPKRCEEE